MILRTSRKKPWALSRRTLLKGSAATVALPFLEAMVSGTARAQSQAQPVRFMAFYAPCGMYMEKWVPAQVGRLTTLPEILMPLLGLREEITVVSQLRNYAGEAEGGGDHARGTASFLTAVHPVKTAGAGIGVGPSVDQVIAEHYAGQTRLRSLELGAEVGQRAGECDSGYSCAYSNNVSWASKSEPVPKEVDPRGAFDRMFAGLDPRATAEERERRRRREKSVLDFVREDARRLKRRLGRRDQEKVEGYLSSVRELERRVESGVQELQCQVPERPEGAAADVEGYVRQMMDLIALAFECDLTRTATFMMGNGGSNRSYAFLGHSGGHHQYSHHQNNEGNLAALQAINTWEVAQFGYLVQKLRDIEEGEGRLLDNCVLMMGSEIADGNAHTKVNMPMVLAGGGGGKVKQGEHVQAEVDTSTGDLLLSVLDIVGVERERFGDEGRQVLRELYREG